MRYLLDFLAVAVTIAAVFIIGCMPHKDTSMENNMDSGAIDLIPFKDNSGLFGYCDKNNFEIIIPAQYTTARPFVGNYAVVHNVNSRKTCRVINKNNKSLINAQFDSARLFPSEDKKTIIAVTSRHKGMSYKFTLNVSEHSWTSKGSVYRYYNLTDGVSPVQKINSSSEHYPEMYAIGEYMSIGRKLYKTFEDGKIQRLENEDPAQVINAILTERKLPFKCYNPAYSYDDITIDFHGDEARKPNEEMLKRLIPENYELRRSHPWDISPITFYGENLLYRFIVKTDDLYLIRLTNKNNQRAIFGVYNDDTGEWVVEPVANGSWYPHPTNDNNIWYLQLAGISDDERRVGRNEFEYIKEKLYNSETGETYPPQMFQLIQKGYLLYSGYPGNQIVYMGYCNR